MTDASSFRTSMISQTSHLVCTFCANNVAKVIISLKTQNITEIMFTFASNNSQQIPIKQHPSLKQ